LITNQALRINQENCFFFTISSFCDCCISHVLQPVDCIVASAQWDAGRFFGPVS